MTDYITHSKDSKQTSCFTLCVYKYTIYVHCRKIENLFAQALETGKPVCKCKLILYLTIMYVYCVYPAISKSPKQLPNCLKITETRVVLNVLKCIICDVSDYTVTFSFCCSTGIRYQKSYILVSDVYNKNLSSQCNLPPQIEPVQDKIAYYTCSFLSIMFLVAALCSLAI